MTAFRLGAICAAGVTMAALSAASAQQGANCTDRERIVLRLSEAYGERRQSIGLGANNAVVEVFASDETGTWTILMTLPNGMSCLVATGSAFEATVGEGIVALDTDA